MSPILPGYSPRSLSGSLIAVNLAANDNSSGRCFCRQQGVDHFVNIETDHLGDIEELHDVDTSAPRFHSRDDGLISAQRIGERRLAQASLLALRDEQLDEALLAW